MTRFGEKGGGKPPSRQTPTAGVDSNRRCARSSIESIPRRQNGSRRSVGIDRFVDSSAFCLRNHSQGTWSSRRVSRPCVGNLTTRRSAASRERDPFRVRIAVAQGLTTATFNLIGGAGVSQADLRYGHIILLLRIQTQRLVFLTSHSILTANTAPWICLGAMLII